MFNKTFKPTQKDITLAYFLIGLFVVCSCIYISNEYLYSKKEYTYQITSADSYAFLNETSTIDITSSTYPTLCNFQLSNLYGYNTSNLYDIYTENHELTDTFSSDVTLESGEWNYNLDKCNSTANFTISAEPTAVSVQTKNAHTTSIFIDTSETPIVSKTFTSVSNYTFCFWFNVASWNRDIIQTFADSTVQYLALVKNGHYTVYDNAALTNVSINIALNTWYFVRVIMDSANHKAWTIVNNTVLYHNTYLLHTSAQTKITFQIGDVGGKFYFDSLSFWTNVNFNFDYLDYLIETFALNHVFSIEFENITTSIYQFDLNYSSDLECLYILNKMNNSYNLIKNMSLTELQDIFIQSNKSITFKVYSIGDVTINVFINVTIDFYNSDFYNLFTQFELSDLEFKINGDIQSDYSFNFTLTESLTFQFDCNIPIFFNIVIVKTYNITKIVEDE